jgi:hypothetical protein
MAPPSDDPHRTTRSLALSPQARTGRRTAAEPGEAARHDEPAPEPEIRPWPPWLRVPLWLGLAILAYLVFLGLGAAVTSLFG